MSFSRASKVTACTIALTVVFGCQTLAEIRAGECGNGIVEQGEDCERTVPGNDPSFRCVACHFICQRGDVAHRCPEGFACGVDGACRAPSGAFDTGTQITARAFNLQTGDFDDDGRAELVATSERSVEVYDLTTKPLALSLRKRISTATERGVVAASPLPALASRNGRRILTSVREGGFVSAFVGTPSRSLQAQFFATFTVSDTDDFVLSSADVLPGSGADLYGNEPLALVATKDGPAMRLVQDAKFIVPVATLTNTPSTFANGLRIGRFDEALPCDQVVLAERRANVVRLAAPCRSAGPAVAAVNRVGDPDYVPPSAINLLAGHVVGEAGVHAVDVDADGHLDLVIDTDRESGGRATLVAFGLGDGRFHGSPPKPLPATPDQTARASDLVDDCESGAGFPRALGQLTRGDTLLDCVLASGVQYRRPTDTRFSAFPGAVKEAILTDFNGDGLLDVVGLTNASVEMVASTGSFGHRLSQAANAPARVTSADVDGDFIADIVFAEGAVADEVASVSLRYGKAGGWPDPPVTLGSSAGITQVLTGAVSGPTGGLDDIADVAVVSRDRNPERNPSKLFSVALLRGRASRELEAPFALGDITAKLRGDANLVTAGRFLGGATDALATVALTTTPLTTEPEMRVWVVPSRAASSSDEDPLVTTAFAPEGVLPGDDALDKRTGGNFAFDWQRARATAFDVDGSGPEELVLLVPPSGEGKGRVFVGGARDGRFVLGSSFELGKRTASARPAWDIAKGDANGDGKAELAIRVDDDGESVFVYAPTSLDLANAGKRVALDPNQHVRSVGAAQLRRTGLRTLLVGVEIAVDPLTKQWGIYTLRPTETGYALGDLVLGLAEPPEAFVAADLDGDGIDDIVVSSGVHVTVFLGRAEGAR